MFSAAVMALYAGGAVSVVRTDPRTGRLVRTVVRAQPVEPATPGPAISATVDQIAQQNEVPAQLIHSVIQVESNYDANAVSPKGALGLMQLIPSTARRFGVSNAFDPADNIQGGVRYLKYLMQLYQGDEALALAAYNAGEAAVARYAGIPPYPETRNYVAAVERRRQNLASEELAQNGRPAPPWFCGDPLLYGGARGRALCASKETRTAPAVVQSNEAPPADAHNPIRVVTDTNGRVYYTSQ
jgi:SLT domain-containing protein